ncbi:DUF5690 family protein [Pedobacter nototheniae]|uniref:DUF5690 family protein n=1 Tax=Pedobacter nototheniae TaxID=2488994 RepID=UPI001039A15D|nr:DUF5690 family protein [Pedobacter nototheniae]
MKSIAKADKISTIWIMIAVFLSYTGMYAIRKSFLAGQYAGIYIGFGLDAKTTFVISQVFGYMVSKFMGIKIISEMPKNKRITWLLGLIIFGLAMLGLFAILPDKLKIIALFFNGLPLGIVFGLVFSFIEGRRNTELLAAALSATFIFSTGLVKTVGLILMQNFGVTEFNMPFLTGIVFLPIFIASLLMLKHAKIPDEKDVAERTVRVPMYGKDRIAFLKANGLGYFGLVAIYVLLTIIRDFRDNFIVDFWAEQGFSKAPQLITLTEIPIALIVLVIAAAGVLIRKNKLAFNFGIWLSVASAMLILLSTLLYQQSTISPVLWIITSGIGIYLPYILFHCLLFERLIALLSYKGNVGFLFYLADALGYLGSVGVLILKEIIGFKQTWSSFFISLNHIAAMIMLALLILVQLYFNKKIPKKKLNELTVAI